MTTPEIVQKFYAEMSRLKTPKRGELLRILTLLLEEDRTDSTCLGGQWHITRIGDPSETCERCGHVGNPSAHWRGGIDLQMQALEQLCKATKEYAEASMEWNKTFARELLDVIEQHVPFVMKGFQQKLDKLRDFTK